MILTPLTFKNQGFHFQHTTSLHFRKEVMVYPVDVSIGWDWQFTWTLTSAYIIICFVAIWSILLSASLTFCYFLLDKFRESLQRNNLIPETSYVVISATNLLDNNSELYNLILVCNFNWVKSASVLTQLKAKKFLKNIS